MAQKIGKNVGPGAAGGKMPTGGAGFVTLSVRVSPDAVIS